MILGMCWTSQIGTGMPTSWTVGGGKLTQNSGLHTNLKALCLELNKILFKIILWKKDYIQSNEPEIFILSRLLYGISCAGSLAHLSLEMMLEYTVDRCTSGCKEGLTIDSCPGLSHHFERIVQAIYVDDSFYSVHTDELRIELQDYISALFFKFSFKVKGFCHSFSTPHCTTLFLMNI